MHSEKRFVKSTKIWFDQQSFPFKYGPMEIFVDTTKHFSGCRNSENYLDSKVSDDF